MSSSIQDFITKLLDEFKKENYRIETNKIFRDLILDYYLKKGLNLKVGILCFKELNHESLLRIDELRNKNPLFFSLNMLIFIENISDFWCDVASIYLNQWRSHNIAIFDLKRKKLQGKLHIKVKNIIKQMNQEQLNIVHVPSITKFKIPALSKNSSASDMNSWLQKVKDHFEIYLTAQCLKINEVLKEEQLKIQIVNKTGYLFIQDISDDLLDQCRELLIKYSDHFKQLVVVGCTGKKTAFERGKDGIIIYALHDDYNVCYFDQIVDEYLFHRFLSKYKDRKPKVYRNHKKTGNHFFTILICIFLLVVIKIGNNKLPVELNKSKLYLFCISFMFWGFLCVKFFKIGKKEYTPAIIGSGLTGLVLSVAFSWATFEFNFFEYMDNDLSLYIKHLLIQSLYLLNFSIAGGIFYTIYTKRNPEKIKPIPPKYQYTPAGNDRQVINTIINSWNRGWFLTIPNLVKKISSIKITLLEGYTAFLESLFEERWIIEKERTSSYASHASLTAARRALRLKIQEINRDRWEYHFFNTPQFDEYQGSIEFVKSGESCICPDCNGNGRVTCGKCEGRGKIKVLTTESYTEYYRDAEGKRQSRSASRFVTEIRTCHVCNGSGKVRCPRCDGNCGILIYPVLKCKRYPKKNKSYYDPTTEKAMKNVLYTSKTKTLIETPIVDRLIDLKTFQNETIPEMAENLGENIVKKLKNSQSTGKHVIRQQLRLLKIPITQLAYQFKKKDYQLWIHGYNNKIHVSDAPFNIFRTVIAVMVLITLLALNVFILIR